MGDEFTDGHTASWQQSCVAAGLRCSRSSDSWPALLLSGPVVTDTLSPSCLHFIVGSSANHTVAYFRSLKLGKVLKLGFCKDTFPCEASLLCPPECAAGLKGSCFCPDKKTALWAEACDFCNTESSLKSPVTLKENDDEMGYDSTSLIREKNVKCTNCLYIQNLGAASRNRNSLAGWAGRKEAKS